jgi:oxygen-independent coproporphyrinogen-3 oxidase
MSSDFMIFYIVEIMSEYLYIHIPFCLKKCIYCDFLSVPYDEGLAKKYIDALNNEIRLRGGHDLRTIYIGGGTPSVLSLKAFDEMFMTIRENFRVSPDAEITVEANPGTIDKEKLDMFRDIGVSRLSIGVQSFVDAELRTLGRMHDSSVAAKALEFVKESEIDNFSMDLIYAIPGQCLESWRHTVSRALEFKPVHISAYELTPETSTPLYGALKTEAIKMPEEDLILDMFDCAADTFGENGLVQYEISNYAIPGFECIHNLNYWRRGEYIGIGASAHSFIGEERIKNTGDVMKYIELLSGNILPYEEIAKVSRKDAIKETIFLGLRMTEGIDLSKFYNEYGLDLRGASDRLLKGGLMKVENGRIMLTGKGLKISNSAIVELFERLKI